MARERDWIVEAKRRGWGDLLSTALDALEPLGPLGAQMVWVAQPVLGVFLPSALVRAFAETLEAPDGIAWLREQLDESEP